jgi:molybdenum cofactor cytidylyltransferase
MVCVILLAAGDWRRLERPVSLLPWGPTTVIEHILDTLAHTDASPVIVVLGHEAWSVRKKIERRPVRIVVDDRHRRGIYSWIQRGLPAAPAEADAAILAFCEQPAVPASTFEGLIEAYTSSGKGIIVPAHRGRRGRPLLFDLRRYRNRMLALGEGCGPEDIALENPHDVLEVPSATPAVVSDITAERRVP